MRIKTFQEWALFLGSGSAPQPEGLEPKTTPPPRGPCPVPSWQGFGRGLSQALDLVPGKGETLQATRGYTCVRACTCACVHSCRCFTFLKSRRHGAHPQFVQLDPGAARSASGTLIIAPSSFYSPWCGCGRPLLWASSHFRTIKWSGLGMQCDTSPSEIGTRVARMGITWRRWDFWFGEGSTFGASHVARPSLVPPLPPPKRVLAFSLWGQT